MKTIINEGERGFLFQDGKFVKMLETGKHRTRKNEKIVTVTVGVDRIVVPDYDPQLFLQDEAFRAQTKEYTAKSGFLTLHFVDGVFLGAVPAGKQYFWQENHEHAFLEVDLSATEFPQGFPSYLYTNPIVMPYVSKIEVPEKRKALLYFDNCFVRLLEPGTYYFVRGSVKVSARTVEACLIQQEVVGQEILTADKVSLRINCTCTYRVTDYVKAVTETEDYSAQLHTEIQLALREYVEGRRLDDILAAKNEMREYLLSTLREKCGEFYVKIEDAAVKDIILPGEIRDIMNTVLIAEKRAQANVVARREEVASTRSLLNTARLLDENETLYKLKELEYIERICEKVGSINLNGSADLLTQLTAVLSHKQEEKKS